MAGLTDSLVFSKTIASTAETLVGRIDITGTEEWSIKKIWASHPSGGEFRLEIGTKNADYAGLLKITNAPLYGEFIQQAVTPESWPIMAPVGQGMYDINVKVTGPNVVKIFATNADATSGLCKSMIIFDRSINRGFG